MDRNKIIKDAVKIGFSFKDPAENYGFRGIGLWSGIAVCDTVWISTKKEGIDKKHIIKIDAKNIRHEIDVARSHIDSEQKNLIQVLKENVGILDEDAPVNEHGTHVRLDKIIDDSKKYLLDSNKVKKYLSLSLPVPFYEDFPFNEDIEKKLRTNVPKYRTVNLFLEEEQIFRSPSYYELESPEFKLLKNNGKVLGYVWFCIHKVKAAIPDPDSRAMIYKKFGFTVGDREIYDDWWKNIVLLLIVVLEKYM